MKCRRYLFIHKNKLVSTQYNVLKFKHSHLCIFYDMVGVEVGFEGKVGRVKRRRKITKTLNSPP